MSELLVKLGIDWRLLIAQLVNFLILFVALRVFLYQPVLDILAKRRARIASGLADADRAAERLAGIEIERTNVLHQAEVERQAMLERAAAEVETLRHERVAAAGIEAAELRTRAQVESERLREELLASVRQELGALVLAVSEKVTAQTLTKETQERVLAQTLDELRATDLLPQR